MSFYYYQVYDTVVQSEFEILNLPVLEAPTDASVEIRIAKHRSERIPVGQYGTYYSADIYVLGTAWGTLEVSDSQRIQVFIEEGYTTADAAPFIIGWGFAFLFQQLGYSILHCSALNLNGKGVIVSGVSGAGKSSTTLELIQKGASYLTDDMAVLDCTGSPELIPAYPIQKVCRDVSLDLDQNELLHINEGRDKFAYHNERDYCNHRVKPTHLVLLKLNEGEELIATEQTGLSKWMRALECLYLNELYVTFGTPEQDKQNCLKLAGEIRVLVISRPRGKDTLNEITKIIYDFVNS